MEEECRAVDANQAQILTRLGRKGMVGLEVSGREGRAKWLAGDGTAG